MSKSRKTERTTKTNTLETCEPEVGLRCISSTTEIDEHSQLTERRNPRIPSATRIPFPSTGTSARTWRPLSSRPANPRTIAASTTAPRSAAPRTAAPRTAGPRTAGPRTTAPRTTASRTTASRTTAPRTTAPRTTSARTTAPRTTAPRTTAPRTTSARTTCARTTAPSATRTIRPKTAPLVQKSKGSAQDVLNRAFCADRSLNRTPPRMDRTQLFGSPHTPTKPFSPGPPMYYSTPKWAGGKRAPLSIGGSPGYGDRLFGAETPADYDVPEVPDPVDIRLEDQDLAAGLALFDTTPLDFGHCHLFENDYSRYPDSLDELDFTYIDTSQGRMRIPDKLRTSGPISPRMRPVPGSGSQRPAAALNQTYTPPQWIPSSSNRTSSPPRSTPYAPNQTYSPPQRTSASPNRTYSSPPCAATCPNRTYSRPAAPRTTQKPAYDQFHSFAPLISSSFNEGSGMGYPAFENANDALDSCLIDDNNFSDGFDYTSDQLSDISGGFLREQSRGINNFYDSSKSLRDPDWAHGNLTGTNADDSFPYLDVDFYEFPATQPEDISGEFLECRPPLREVFGDEVTSPPPYSFSDDWFYYFQDEAGDTFRVNKLLHFGPRTERALNSYNVGEARNMNGTYDAGQRNLNSTYNKSPCLNATFDIPNIGGGQSPCLNATYDVPNIGGGQSPCLNATYDVPNIGGGQSPCLNATYDVPNIGGGQSPCLNATYDVPNIGGGQSPCLNATFDMPDTGGGQSPCLNATFDISNIGGAQSPGLNATYDASYSGGAQSSYLNGTFDASNIRGAEYPRMNATFPATNIGRAQFSRLNGTCGTSPRSRSYSPNASYYPNSSYDESNTSNAMYVTCLDTLENSAADQTGGNQYSGAYNTADSFSDDTASISQSSPLRSRTGSPEAAAINDSNIVLYQFLSTSQRVLQELANGVGVVHITPFRRQITDDSMYNDAFNQLGPIEALPGWARERVPYLDESGPVESPQWARDASLPVDESYVEPRNQLDRQTTWGRPRQRCPRRPDDIVNSTFIDPRNISYRRGSTPPELQNIVQLSPNTVVVESHYPSPNSPPGTSHSIRPFSLLNYGLRRLKFW